MSSYCIKLVLLAFMAVSIFVPTSVAFGLSGAVFSEEVSPGQQLLHVISVSNRPEASPQNMTAEIYGFARSVSGTNIEISPEEDTGPYSARPFLSVEPKSFVLEPGERKTLLLTGVVPDDVGSGGRYALVTIRTAPENSSEGVLISTAIQAQVLLTIKDGDVIKAGEISELSGNVGDEGVTVDLLFENTGNVHYKPFVGAALISEAGEIIAKQEPVEERSSILPTNSRLVKMTLVPDAVLEPGTYTVEATVALDDGTVLATEDTTVEV